MMIVLTASYGLTGTKELRALNVGRMIMIEGCNFNEIQAGFDTKIIYQDSDGEDNVIYCVDMFVDVIKRIGAV